MGKVFGIKMHKPMREAVEAEAEGLGLYASEFARIAIVTLIEEAHSRREDPGFYKDITARAVKARAS